MKERVRRGRKGREGRQGNGMEGGREREKDAEEGRGQRAGKGVIVFRVCNTLGGTSVF